MKKYYSTSIFALIIGFLLISCDSDYGRPEPYTPYMENAPNYGSKVYINTQIPPVNQYSFTASFTEKENILKIEGDSVSKFSVRMTSPATERTVVKLAIDETYIDKYNKENEVDYVLMSKDNYVVDKDEVVIEAGQQESKDSISITVKMDAAQVKKIEKPLLLPLRITSVNGKTEGISRNFDLVTISGKINLVLDNIDSSNEQIDGTVFNDGITLNSNRTTGLASLINGNLTGGGYWYPSNTSTYLELHLPEEQLIKGLIINTGLGTYQFASVRVVTQRSSGKIIQGVFTTTETGREFYVRFKEPISAKVFRLENFLTLRGGVQPDIYEVRLVK